MLRLLRFLLSFLARGIVSLRYRVRIHGLEKLEGLNGPVLLLPNHPAYIDPVVVLSALYPHFHPRPLLYEGNFANPLLAPIPPLMDALTVPDLAQASQEARQRAQQAIQGVIDALKAGDNVILWPSGHVQHTNSERIGAARTLADVLSALPNINVVLVRTRGLWGSMFSYARTGKKPPLVKTLFKGLGLLLANGLFFTPRRNVTLTLEKFDPSKLPDARRETVNRAVESWYNVDAPEAPTFVRPHFLFGPRSFDYPQVSTSADLDLSDVKPETKQQVLEMVQEKLGRPLSEGERSAETGLDQLGMDSLDRMELGLSVERRFGFSGDQVPANMGQLFALASGLLQRQPPQPPPPLWFNIPREEGLVQILADTIPEAFVARALANPGDVSVCDDRSGALTYERLLTGALLTAKRFAALPGDNVGLLLPASVGCDLALLGLFLAGKVPVLLNWTTGPANLEHAARIMNLKSVVSSTAFIDRVGVKVEGTDYVFLEEMRKGIGKLESLWTLLKVRWFPGSIRSACPKPSPDSPAVVLFTSGSEKAPKAVPLTHRNILTNQRAGTSVLKVTRHDSMLAFLPAFHSFGMSITGIYPLLTGIRVVRHPDPTDAAALARKAGLYQTTILVGTPTFASYILERAEPGELSSLRMVILGAEKCPQVVFDRFKEASPRAEVLEGYGITECSPVVSVNPPEDNRHGTVGKPLPGVEVRLVDLESDQTLPAGQMGMLLVAGPTVFPGYLGYDGPSPFREIDGKRYYVTGDLVELDSDGYIHFSGRLKRFIKAGGEMISLPALEEPFVRKFPPTKDGPRVAVEGVEMPGGGRKVVLFSTEPVTLQEANALLLKEGFHGVMRLDEVRQVEKLPVLGTGKTDYKVLRARVTAEEKETAGVG